MVTSAERVPQAAGAATARGHEDRMQRWIAWVREHRRGVSYAIGAVLVVAVLAAWNVLAAKRSEAIASDQLRQARLAFEQQNYPLAASEFARIRENYGGTSAAEQATLLLAQTRLLQGQAQQAVDVLSRFAGSAGAAYRAQAHGLLGAAYENSGRPAEAARAFEQAAEATGFPSMKAQFLSDAGRAWTAAGDTTNAIATYQRIVRDLAGTGSMPEASVRLGELTRGSVTLPRPRQ
jgi:predicted negative regulator of RcsB-dependent stress response